VIRLITDEHVPAAVARGFRARVLGVDVVRIPDVGLLGAADPALLAWAAAEGRVVVSRDRRTLIGLAHARVAAGEPMPGLIAYKPDTPVGRVIDDVATILGVLTDDDMRGRVEYIPL
jgi:hypothetical protein